VSFAGGVIGVALVNELTEYMRFEIDLQGTTGVLRLGNDTAEIACAKLVSFEAAHAETPDFEWQVLESEPLPAIPSAPAFALAARELIDALEGRASISSTGADGRASMEIIMAIYESQRRQCPGSAATAGWRIAAGRAGARAGLGSAGSR
jgi:predicted dehydrogenase